MLVLLVGTMMLASEARSETSCLPYEPAVVELKGSVVYRTFAEANDRPERVALLLLDEPICVEAQPEGDFNVSEGDQVVIHLNADPARFGSEGDLAGRTVTATGTLYHAHSAHHHAALVLQVHKLRVEDRNRALQPTRAAEPNGQREAPRVGPRLNAGR